MGNRFITIIHCVPPTSIADIATCNISQEISKILCFIKIPCITIDMTFPSF